jgi:hypothetical protein
MPCGFLANARHAGEDAVMEEESQRISNHIKVTLAMNGVSYSALSEFNETTLKAQGPMSLESGLMSLVRELSQNLYRQWKDRS